jgi:hypothetical protein
MSIFRKTGVVGTGFVGLEITQLRQMAPASYVGGEAGRGRLRCDTGCRKR